MAYDSNDNRLRRKDAVGMERLVKDFIREMRLSSGLDRQRAHEAWVQVNIHWMFLLTVEYFMFP